jgi:hypothetical protein
MDAFWLVLAFSIGGSLGFLLFAVVRSARESLSKHRGKSHVGLSPFELEGDTVTRF